MVRVLAVLLLALAIGAPAVAASVSRTYNYFTIGGHTFEELQSQIESRGPKVESTGLRHAGATRMEFNTRISYGEADGRCRVVEANVSVKARVTLPRWTQRRRAAADVQLFWDALSRDIKRHEESHIVIARTHARELEMTLVDLPSGRDCESVAERAKVETQLMLARHDRAQENFDRVESINFEDRILRLIRYRIERMEAERGAD